MVLRSLLSKIILRMNKETWTIYVLGVIVPNANRVGNNEEESYMSTPRESEIRIAPALEECSGRLTL